MDLSCLPACHTTFVSLVVFYLLNSFWAGLASAFGPFPKLHNRDLLPCQKTGSGQRLEFVMLVAANTAYRRDEVQAQSLNSTPPEFYFQTCSFQRPTQVTSLGDINKLALETVF